MAQYAFLSSIEGADDVAAYAEVLPLAQQLAADNLVYLNVEVEAGLITVFGVLPKLEPLVEDMQRLPDFDFKNVENLKQFALALNVAQADYTHATTPLQNLPELLARGAKFRDLFLADCAALIARGLLDPHVTNSYKGQGGYKNVAFDLRGLERLLRTSWPTIEGKTAITLKDLDEAKSIAMSLQAGVAHREQSPEKIAAATDTRLRMFTLFARAYEQVRRAVLFLRWDYGDADKFAPSLYAGRGGSAKKTPSNETLDTGARATPDATPDAPSAPATQAADPAAAKLPAGHPASLPFSAA